MSPPPRVPRERRTGELDLFRLYLDQAGRHPLLTRQDEVELSQAYRQGLDAQLNWPTPAPTTRPAPSWRPSPSGASGPAAG
jgi:hypothetical protein